MLARALDINDEPELKTIHATHDYDFEFPDFFKNFLCAFAICDDDGKIITAAGVRVICEVVAVTDKDINISQRQKALYKMLDAAKYITAKHDFDELHAIVLGDEKWEKHLKNHGFKDSRGKWLVLPLE